MAFKRTFFQFSSAQRRVITMGILLLSIVLVSIIFRELGSILKPFFIAIFLCYLMQPGVSYLASKRIPLAFCYLIMVFIFLGIIYLLGILIYANLQNFLDDFPTYEKRITGFISNILVRLHVIGSAEEFRLRDLSFLKLIPSGSITSFVKDSLGSFVSLLGNSTVVIFFVLFLIVEAQVFEKRIFEAYGEKRATEIMEVVSGINSSIRKYIIVKITISFFTAIIATSVMAIFGLKFFVLFGILTFIFNFIPYIGSIIATILPILMALLQFHSPWTALWIGLLLIGTQNIMGSIVEPKITGDQLDLSPLVVLISLWFWGWLWGVVGMILSIPIMAALKIIFEHIEATKSTSIMMSKI
ncbi:AI-2E family transporter [candidate division KSB1 bacterium]|nr:AI-2E family transporter [candidate division KSB1 bacterium]